MATQRLVCLLASFGPFGCGGDGGANLRSCDRDDCLESFEVREVSIDPELEIVFLADLSGDGSAELVTHHGEEFVVFDGNTLAELGRHPSATETPPTLSYWFYPAGDLDGDDSEEFVLAPGSWVFVATSGTFDSPLGPYTFPTTDLDDVDLVFSGGTPSTGSPDSTVTTIDWNQDGVKDVVTKLDPDRLAVFDGAGGERLALLSSDEGGFGWVKGAGDLDGDGQGDLLVANGSAGPHGRVVVLAGGTGDPIYQRPVPGTEAESEFSGLGRAIDRIGDVDGDGVDDFVVCDHDKSGGDPEFTGVLYAFSGASGDILYTVRQPRNEDPLVIEQFCSAIHAAGDMNGDDIPDYVVHSPFYQNFELGPDIVRKARILSGNTGELLFSEMGEYRYMWVADLNGDGAGDLVLQETYPKREIVPTGRLKIVYGVPR